MKVWLNKALNGEETGWEMSSGRRLLLVNKTGQDGNCIWNVNLGYIRKGRTSYIFLNKPKKRPSSKTVGIFIWRGTYRSFSHERFVGKTEGEKGFDGMFGIYNVGAYIETDDGSRWELLESAGWRRI